MFDIPNPENFKLSVDQNQNVNSIKDSKEILVRILESRQKIMEAKKRNITFSKPILMQNGNPVFFPKTINVIQGKAGVHKSRLAESICSALLSKQDCNNDLLDYRTETHNKLAVVYVDTERNLTEQLPYALQQIQLKAGYNIEDEIPNFDFISLLEFERSDRFNFLKIYLEYVRSKFSNHIFIVLDVITDCVFNFNDINESMKLIDMMNTSINKFDVTFLCLIHENPGMGDKARGHLGTEILNKSSTVIQIGFEKDKNQNSMDLIKISYLKCRNSKKHDPLYVQYSEEQKGLVIADNGIVRDALEKKKFKANYDTIIEHLKIFLTEPKTKKDLFNYLRIELDCSDRTLEDRLSEIMEDKMTLINLEYIDCNLQKNPDGRKTTYSLVPVEPVLPF